MHDQQSHDQQDVADAADLAEIATAGARAFYGPIPRGFRKNRADKRREGQRGEGRHLRARPGKLAPHHLARVEAEVTA